MNEPSAYGVHQEFPPAPAGPFKVDRHYLLYASQGAMRLSAEGKTWSLPPARAALIRANREITVTLPQKMTICSALFSPDHFAAPAAALAVFDMTPLARELVLECAKWPADAGEPDAHNKLLFDTLSAVTWKLAQSPSPTAMPTGKSEALLKAVKLTEAGLAADINFATIAAQVAMTPRSLARRFSQELGMTWRQALRKLRMIRAIEYLAASEATVTEIAFSVGYNSLSAFNSAFLDFTGKTPTEYRHSFQP